MVVVFPWYIAWCRVRGDKGKCICASRHCHQLQRSMTGRLTNTNRHILTIFFCMAMETLPPTSTGHLGNCLSTMTAVENVDIHWTICLLMASDHLPPSLALLLLYGCVSQNRASVITNCIPCVYVKITCILQGN